MKRIHIVLPVMLVGATALAMASGVTVQESDWDVPEEARAQKNPLEGTPDVVAAGATLYEKHCQMCHGTEGKGDGRMAKMIKPTPRDISTGELRDRLTDGEIFYKITVGKKPMPPMGGKLIEDEIWSVVHYVRSLQPK